MIVVIVFIYKKADVVVVVVLFFFRFHVIFLLHGLLLEKKFLGVHERANTILAKDQFDITFNTFRFYWQILQSGSD